MHAQPPRAETSVPGDLGRPWQPLQNQVNQDTDLSFCKMSEVRKCVLLLLDDALCIYVHILASHNEKVCLNSWTYT